MQALTTLALLALVAAQDSCPAVSFLYRPSYSSYVALGDSYTVGLGSLSRLPVCPVGDYNASSTCTTVGPLFSGPDACDKDQGSYAWQFAKQYVTPGGFLFPACSGADTAAVNQLQLKYVDRPDLVTVQVGGDDDSTFSNVIKACLLATDEAVCLSTVRNATSNLGVILAKVATVLDGIDRRVSPATTKALVGYVQFFGLQQDCTIETGLGNSTPSVIVRRAVNDLVFQANLRLQRLAATRGYLFINADPGFETHRWCDTVPWWLISTVTTNGVDASGVNYTEVALGHPSNDGQQAYLAALKAALRLA